jgi:hypothetical protein
MENDLRVLFIKQAHDNVGPKTSYGYTKDISAKDLLSHFNGKTSLFETLLYYKCDFAIIPTKVGSPWLNTMVSIPQYKEFLESKTTNVVDPTQIDFDNYDVVITHDPILHPYIKELKEKYKSTVFCFIMVEHSSWQMHQFGFEYDLWLDHTLNSTNDIVRLPQAINYFFPRVPDVVSDMFNYPKNSVFVDYRSYGHFIGGGNNVALTTQQISEFNNSLDIELPIEPISETSLKPYMFVTNSDDSIAFYQKMSRAKYFVTIANRVGQASFDAASMGCLVIGNSKSQMHKLLCHSDCLMSGEFTYEDVTKLIKKIESDTEYYQTLLMYQNEQLNKWAVNHPMNVLKSAVKLKKNELQK